MTSLNVSMPEPMKAFVESQVADGGYSTASEYIRSLIREAQQSQSDKVLEGWLMMGLNRSDFGTITDDEWEARRREHRARRVEVLQREVALGLEDLRCGRSSPASDVFKRLRQRNRRISRGKKQA
ncbi:MAG TPA: type II toxin-antitoxin system ParD family antitoxin [Pirellulales bacterium]|nr:type II toxin-antitoxin system ParD family antitoxin [Pirellulales bacterium]